MMIKLFLLAMTSNFYHRDIIPVNQPKAFKIKDAKNMALRFTAVC
jgi:hypothetical protein